MYYALLQQRYGTGINKQAGLWDRTTQLFNRGVQAVGRVGGRASRDAARTVSGKGSAVNARKFIDDIVAKPEASRTVIEKANLDKFNTLRNNAALKLGKDRLIAAGAGAGLAGYGTYNMFSGDDTTPTATTTATTTQTPNMSDAQLMAQNGWNGWNWDDLGGSLANYITSGKIAEHAIPAILAYIAGRAMS